MNLNKIERIGLFTFVGVVILSLIAVPSISFINFKIENPDIPSTSISEVLLEKLEVSLKENVQYYNNFQAIPNKDDFIVKAIYDDESIKELESFEYKITYNDDFSYVGGDVVFHYEDVKQSLPITLTEVEMTSLVIKEKPYNVHYKSGDVFNPEGMIVVARYNDGTSKIVNDYAYPKKSLSINDSKVDITYYGFNASVEVDVKSSIVNGNIVDFYVPDVSIDEGHSMTVQELEIYGVYESGNRIKIDSSMYDVNLPTYPAHFGIEYPVEIFLKNNLEINTKVLIPVVSQFYAENCSIRGGRILSDRGMYRVGDFLPDDTSNEQSISFIVDSNSEDSVSIVMNVVNGFIINDTTKNMSWANPLQINTILSLTVNDMEVNISDSVYAKGLKANSSNMAANLNYKFQEISLEDVPLEIGNNTIKLSFIPSTLGQTDELGNTPSLSFESFVIESKGQSFDEKNLVRINGRSIKTYEPNEIIEKDSFRLMGYYNDGRSKVLDASEVDIEGYFGPAQVGAMNLYEVTHRASGVKATIPIIVTSILEAENAEITSGDITYDSNCNYAGGFDTSKGASLSFNFTMAKAKNDASIYINAAYMAWIHMNDVFTIKVNDQVVTILDGAFLPDSYGSWTNFRSIEVVKANLKEGHNNIRFEFKNYASAINVDYIRID